MVNREEVCRLSLISGRSLLALEESEACYQWPMNGFNNLTASKSETVLRPRKRASPTLWRYHFSAEMKLRQDMWRRRPRRQPSTQESDRWVLGEERTDNPISGGVRDLCFLRQFRRITFAHLPFHLWYRQQSQRRVLTILTSGQGLSSPLILHIVGLGVSVPRVLVCQSVAVIIVNNESCGPGNGTLALRLPRPNSAAHTDRQTGRHALQHANCS